jgi:hypothetical protein
VRFEAVPETATAGQDYTISSSDVILSPGEAEKPVPVLIVNDPLPELAETFTIRLVPGSATGSAVLGKLLETRVTILKSDDPNGAFGRWYHSRVMLNQSHHLPGSLYLSLCPPFPFPFPYVPPFLPFPTQG